MDQLQPNNLENFEESVNEIYSGKKPVPPATPYANSGTNPNPHQVESRVTGKTPGKLPSQMPPGTPKTFDAKAYSEAVRLGVSANTISHEDQNDWGKTYAYNAGYKGLFYDKYSKVEDRLNGIYFHPDFEFNEETYAANTSFLGDVYRTVRYSALPQFWNGVKSNYANITELISGDLGPSTRLARDYSYNTQLTYSTKNNLGSFVNNLMNNFSYTLGIMATAIAENKIGGLLGASKALGTGAANLTMRNLIAGKSIDGMKSYSQMIDEMGDLNTLRQRFEASRPDKLQKFFEKPFVSAINPFSNLTDNYYGILNQTDDFSGYFATYNNLARTAGAAYRDFRNINLAVSEAKLEGGMVYNDLFEEFYNDFYSEKGRHPNDEELENIMNFAHRASYETVVMNSGLIYFTNKLAFDNILNPRIGTRGYLASKIKEWKSIGGGRFGELGKVGYNIPKGEWKFYNRGFKSWYNGWKTDPLPKSIHHTVGYFKRNILEGLQESAQEAIAYANENYYKDAYYTQPVRKNLISKAAFGPNTTPLSYYGKGLAKQVSPEGFSVFASGFAMGSLAGGLNTTMTYLMEKGAQIYDKGGYENYTKEKTKIAQELVDRLNSMGFKEFADSKLLNAGTQDIVKSIQDDGTKKEVMDAESEAMAQHFMTLYEYGVLDMQLDAFESFQDMTNEEFAEANPKLPAEDIAKYKSRVSDVVEKGRRIKERMDTYLKVYPNPIDLTRYDKDDEGYEDAEIMKYMWDFSVKSAVFYNETFDDVRQRMTKIMENHYNDRALSSMSKRQSDIILRPEELLNEIGLLNNEINSLLAVGDPESKRLAKEKKRLVDAYQQYADVYDAFTNTYHRSRYYDRAKQILQKEKAEGETVTQEEIDAYLDEELGATSPEQEEKILLDLEESYNNLLRVISNKPDDYLFTDKVDQGFEMVLDFYKLNDESRRMADFINLMNDPEGFMDVYKRNLQWMTDLWLKRGDYYRDIVTKELSELEDNALLNHLAKKGIFLDINDFINYRDNGIPPREFYDEKKQLVIPEGSLAYDRYFSILKLLEGFKELEVFAKREALKADLEIRIGKLVERRDAQLTKAEQLFEENLRETTGKTREEWEKEEPAVTGRTQAEIDDEIKGLSDILYTIQNSTSVEEILQLYSALEEQGYIPENIQEIVDEESVANEVELKKFFKSTKDGKYDVETRQQAALMKFTLPRVLNDKIAEVSQEQPVKESDQVKPIEKTKAWQDYQKNIDKINERYTVLIEKLKAQMPEEEEVEEEAPIVPVSTTRAPSAVKVTTETPWEDLPEDFRTELEKIFDGVVSRPTSEGGLGQSADLKKNDPAKYELLRGNWYEQQSELIDAYNSRKVVQKTPEISFATLTKPIETYPVSTLVVLRKELEAILDSGYYDKEKLTPDERNILKKDIKELNDYINYKRGVEMPKNNKQRIFRIFEEMVINKQNKAQRILDEDGNTIGYTLEGLDGRPIRVTLLAEKIEVDMTPGKKPFKYDPIEEPYEKDGKIVGGQLLNLFDQLKSDTDYKSDEARLKDFMSALNAEVKKAHLKQLNSPRKLKAIKDALTNNFTKEAMVAVIKKVAYDESTTAGNTADNMIRTAFSLDSEGKYQKPEKTDKIAQDAYDNLFGEKGIITELQDYTLGENPKYTILSSDAIIFDASLNPMDETGVVGAMDLVVFDNELNKLFIIDLKTGKMDNWKEFNNPKSKYSKKLNYRLQQSIYRAIVYNMTGELADISIMPIATEVDMNGNILTATSVAKMLNEPVLRPLKAQLTALERQSKPDESKIKALKEKIKAIERSSIVMLDPVEGLDKYGIILKKPDLPDNLKPEAVGKKAVADELTPEQAKKEIAKLKGQLTKTNNKIAALPNAGLIPVGNQLMESPELEKLVANKSRLESEIARLQAIAEGAKEVTEEGDVEDEIKIARGKGTGLVKPAAKPKQNKDVTDALKKIAEAKDLETLEEIRTDIQLMIISDPDVANSAKTLEAAIVAKREALKTSVSEENLKPKDYLISKKPIFGTEENEIVVVAKVADGKITVKQIGVKNPKQKTLSEAQIKADFIKTTEEALNQQEMVEPVNEEQKEKAEISKSSITDLGTNPELLQKGKEIAQGDAKTRLGALKAAAKKNNIDNCNG